MRGQLSAECLDAPVLPIKAAAVGHFPRPRTKATHTLSGGQPHPQLPSLEEDGFLIPA